LSGQGLQAKLRQRPGGSGGDEDGEDGQIPGARKVENSKPLFLLSAFSWKNVQKPLIFRVGAGEGNRTRLYVEVQAVGSVQRMGLLWRILEASYLP